MELDDRNRIQPVASIGQRTAPNPQKALSKESDAPRLAVYMRPNIMLVAVIADPRPRPKRNKNGAAKCPRQSAKKIEPTIRSRYPRTRLLFKLDCIRSAPLEDPAN